MTSSDSIPLICPICHETNPPDAVICWSCYTELGANSPPPPKQPPRIPEETFFYMFLAGVATLIAAGWLPRKHAKNGIFSGLSLIGISVLPARLESIKDFRLECCGRTLIGKPPAEPPGTLVHEPPSQRMANRILREALETRADAIRLSAGYRRVEVDFHVDGTWTPVMHTPSFIAGDMFRFLCTRWGADPIPSPEGGFPLSMSGREYSVKFKREDTGLVHQLVLDISPSNP